MKSKKESMHVSEFNKIKAKPQTRAPVQKKVESAKELMQLDTSETDEALEAITLNSKAEHVEYNVMEKGKQFHRITLKNGKIFRIMAEEEKY